MAGLDPAPVESQITKLRPVADREAGTLTGAQAELELAYGLGLLWKQDEAIRAYREAAERARRLGNRALTLEAEIGLAKAYGAIREHGKALAILLQAEQDAGAGSGREKLQFLACAADLSGLRGEPLTSLAYASEELSLAAEPDDRALAWMNVGNALRTLASVQKSQVDYEAAIRTVRAAGRAYLHAAGAVGEGDARGLRSHAQAMQRLNDVDLQTLHKMVDFLDGAKARSAGFYDAPSMVLTWTPDDPRFTTDLDAGVGSAAADARAMLPTATLPPGAEASMKKTVPVLVLEGMEAAGHGDRARAESLWRQAVAQLEKERGSIFDVENRGTVIEVNSGTHELLAFEELRIGQNAEAFSVFESIRARGLAELAIAGDARRASDGDGALVTRLITLDAKVASAERDLEESILESPESRPDARLLDALITARTERNRLLVAGRARLDRLAAVPRQPLADLASVETAVKKSRIPVLFYWTGPQFVSGWIIAPGGSRILNIGFPEFARTEKIAKLRSSLETQAERFEDGPARDLHQLLLRPFRDLIRDAPELIIVPQGDLHQIPFEALVDGDTGESVVDRIAVSYAANATMALEALRRRWQPPARTVAIYDPQIDAGTGEVEALAKALRGTKVDRVSTVGLRRAALDGAAREADLLHILVHGMFDARAPMLSTLSFTRSSFGGSARPVLTAAEIAGLPLRHTSLAVLSACESANVQVRLSNEIFGFPWAVLTAGAERALVTRWRVSAVSQGQWMARFYEALAKGERPSLAAAAAMRALKREKTTAHPYWWAAPQMMGR